MTEMSEQQLKSLMEQAAEMGAERALHKVGLGDDNAGNDVRDLRELMSSWRDVKKTFIRAIVKDFAKVVLGALAFGAWMKFGSH